jgi:hypothetical protein
MHKPSFFGLFYRSILVVSALLLPTLAFAAPQAATSPAATKPAAAQPGSTASRPTMSSKLRVHRAMKFNATTTSSRSKLVATQDDGSPLLTPPQWYLDDLDPELGFDFPPEIPKQIIGTTGVPFPLVITNSSTDTTVIVTSITGDNDQEFTFGGTCTAQAGIAPGATCVLEVTYNAAIICEASTVNITFNDNDPNGPLVLNLNSYGAASDGLTTDDLRDTSLSATSLAQSLVGPGVTISNVTYTGSPWALGNFAGGAGIIGFDKGILLSNGAVSNVIGPNCSTGITQSNATPGDTDLSNLIGGVTNDAAVLEFDFVPANPTISFQYVFASDEYQDFVFDYNDVFAFFLGAPGNTNDIALIPGTNTIVSINNVNNGSTDPVDGNIPAVNPQFYVNNDFQFNGLDIAPYDTEMDGMTVVLTASAQVTPGQKNHIKLAIADATDTLYDSNVFIRAGSLVSSVLSVTPTGLGFGNLNVGNTAAPQSVTITNVGSAPLTPLAITSSSPAFTQTNNCPQSLAPNASCVITVSFSSPNAGTYQGNIQVADNAGDSPQLIGVSGTMISGPYATFSPVGLTFGTQAQGTTSQPLTLTLKNTGTAALQITQVQLYSQANPQFELPTEFAISNDLCSDSSVAVGGTCTVTVVYAPDENSSVPFGSADIDAVIFSDNGQNQGQQQAGLSGGLTVSVTLTPPTLAFGNQKVGTTSTVQPITITNSGTGTVNIASVVVPVGFSETNNCVSAAGLATTASCTINVAFAPGAAQAYSGVVTITDNVPNSPQTISLSGTGTAATAALTLTPTSQSFGSIAVGSSSEPVTFTLTNVGTAAIDLGNITSSAGFTDTTNCGDGLNPAGNDGSSCTVQVSFAPTATGAATGTLTVNYTVVGNTNNLTATSSLSGTGTGATGTITVSPSSLSFGSQVVNTTSGAQTITITNTGTTAVTVSSVTVPGGYAQTNNCTSIAASGTCTINVTFTPLAAQSYTGNVTITDSAAGSPHLVAVSGTGVTSQVIISIPSGGSNTATSVPGGTAYFGLVIAPAPGFSGTVQLSCTTSSPTVTCTPVPSTVTLVAGSPIEVAFGIQTYCKGTTTNSPGNGSLPALPTLPGGTAGIALGILTLALSGASFAYRRNPRAAIALALVLIVILAGAACSGGPAKGPNGITPAGTYYITLTATTSGGTTVLTNYLTLVVN